ncbi:hypothetical protein [Kutzneria sp. NPDC052558]|uniref:hypothetical protein n=1 Tax=Kutzneria sp. NPDC052558 TaxID=3364121 RepID=UPI0037CC3A3E
MSTAAVPFVRRRYRDRRRGLSANTSRSDPLLTQFAYLNQDICSMAPTAVYSAGRGADAGNADTVWNKAVTPDGTKASC